MGEVPLESSHLAVPSGRRLQVNAGRSVLRRHGTHHSMKFSRSMRFKLQTIRQLTARIESLAKEIDHEEPQKLLGHPEGMTAFKTGSLIKGG